MAEDICLYGYDTKLGDDVLDHTFAMAAFYSPTMLVQDLSCGYYKGFKVSCELSRLSACSLWNWVVMDNYFSGSLSI